MPASVTVKDKLLDIKEFVRLKKINLKNKGWNVRKEEEGKFVQASSYLSPLFLQIHKTWTVFSVNPSGICCIYGNDFHVLKYYYLNKIESNFWFDSDTHSFLHMGELQPNISVGMASFHLECLVTSWKFQLTTSVQFSIPSLQQWVGWAKETPNKNSLHIAKSLTNKLHFRKKLPIPGSWWPKKEVINQKSQSFPTLSAVTSPQAESLHYRVWMSQHLQLHFPPFFCTDDIKLVCYLTSQYILRMDFAFSFFFYA